MKKNLRPYLHLSRLAPASHFRATTLHEPLSAYSAANLLSWAKHVGAYWLHKKYPFPVPYSVAPPATVWIDNATRLAIAGDWGSGTDEAQAVAVQILRARPDYSIHLGDIYFVGSAKEIDENFLGVPASQYEPVAWPRGYRGSFSLCGNHDMYSNGSAYFTKLLPALQQPASFFRLENEHWVILGLDTGYNSTGIDFWPLRPSCALPGPVLQWLEANPVPLHKQVIVLTHHQPWSAFDTAYPAPAKQLARVLTNPFLWIWGHEHRAAAYDVHTAYGVTARGFCAGHGGMPVEPKQPNGKVKVLFSDYRLYPNDERLEIGYNGHINVNLAGPSLYLEFVDLAGRVLHTYRQ